MAKYNFYAVKAGRQPGIYDNWADTNAQVSGFPGQKYKGFVTKAEALAYMGDDWAPAPEAEPAITAEPALPEIPEPGLPVYAVPEGTPAYTTDPELETFLAKYYPERQFTPDQKEAIRSVEGRHLLFAIPGSGKTAVLTARAGYMLSRGIEPDSLLIMTFGKSAADHMKDVFLKRFGDLPCPEFCTIHSFCNGVLKKLEKMTGVPRPRLICDDEDDPVPESEAVGGILAEPEEEGREDSHEDSYTDEKKGNKYAGRRNPINILTKILRGMFTDQQHPDKAPDVRPLAESCATVISCIKNRMLTDAEINALGLIDLGRLVDIAAVYRAYTDELRGHQPEEMDFDDMLRRAYDGLTAHPQLLTYYRRKYRYISVDEAQDTSHLQHMVIRLLAGDTGRLFMVGDDDQSIYAFRGAAPREMLEFDRTYAGAVIHRMGVNFRSDRGIVTASDKLIEANLVRAGKEMAPASTLPGAIIFRDMTHDMQVRYILDSARRVLDENRARRAEWERLPEETRGKFRPRSLAILYRNNASALVPLAYFFRNDIPFTCNRIFDILNMLYSRTAINLIRLLEFTQKPCDFKAYRHAWYVFNNYKGLFIKKEQAIDEVWELYEGHEGEPVLPYLSRALEADGQSEKARHVLEVQQVLDRIRAEDSPYAAFRAILMELSFNENNCMKSRGTQLMVQALIEIGCLYGSIREYLDALSLMRARKNWGEKPEEGMEELVLSTMHSSKGQEYDDVIILDATDAVIPGNNPNRPLDFWYDNRQEQIEEERRLFYVACTRARHQLEILVDGFSNAHSRCEPSRFVRELYACAGKPEIQNASAEYQSGGVGLDFDELFGTKYYAVRHGKKPGVHTDFETAGIRGEKGVIWMSAKSEADALRFLHKNVPVDAAGLSGADTPRDLPEGLNARLPALFGKRSLADFTPAECDTVFRRTLSLYSWEPHAPQATDYSACAREYALTYLPVNLYKVWTPLFALLQNGTLPLRDTHQNHEPVRVLELGAGPGTATLGLLSFYAAIAAQNPDEHFTIEYTAVEREPGFCEVFNRLVLPYIKELPANLSVKPELKQADAQAWLRRCAGMNYDLILESNMINPNEYVCRAGLRELLGRCHGALEHFGKLLMIEPYDDRSVQFLKDVCAITQDDEHFDVPQYSLNETADLSAGSLLRQVCACRMRRKPIEKHGFSYAVITKK